MWNAINLKVLLVILATIAALLAGMKTLNSHLAQVKVVVINPAPQETPLTDAEKRSIQQAQAGFKPKPKSKAYEVFTK